MNLPGTAITVIANLRASCPPIRDQGSRPTCLACAASDAHSMHHQCPPLSAEFLFYQAIQLAAVGNLIDGILFEEAAAALDQYGQPSELEWPYNPTQPDPWAPPAVTTIWRANLTSDTADAITRIVSLVKGGRPVILGVELSAQFLDPVPSDFIIPATGTGFGGHAVLAVGVGEISGALFFLIRNSWGDKWGDQGYAWLDANYLTDKLIGFAPIVAKP